VGWQPHSAQLSEQRRCIPALSLGILHRGPVMSKAGQVRSSSDFASLHPTIPLAVQWSPRLIIRSFGHSVVGSRPTPGWRLDGFVLEYRRILWIHRQGLHHRAAALERWVTDEMTHAVPAFSVAGRGPEVRLALPRGPGDNDGGVPRLRVCVGQRLGIRVRDGCGNGQRGEEHECQLHVARRGWLV
jgi:hypothetical protein